MGPRHSKQPQLNFMKDCQVIQQNNSENITYLQHQQTEEEYLLKEFNFNDKKECEKMMEKLSQLKTKLAGNKHVVPLREYLMTAEDQYCSTFYKIYAMYQYPQRTLDDQINQRKLHKKRFTQTQLWSILASCIVGLSHLQKNGIKHSALKSSNILLSKQGIIKVADPLGIGQQPNYDCALTKRSIQHVYLSPQLTQALQQQTISPSFNPYKSDIWTLGMIMLEAGLLQYQDEQCYRDQKSRIHWDTVKYNIDRLGQAYSDQIKSMVEFMLSKDERARPDWNDLEEHVMKAGDQVRRSFIQQQTNPNPNVPNISTNSNFVASSNQPVSTASNLGTSQNNQPKIVHSNIVTSNVGSLGNFPVQANPQITIGNNILSGSNNTFGRYSGVPQSPANNPFPPMQSTPVNPNIGYRNPSINYHVSPVYVAPQPHVPFPFVPMGVNQQVPMNISQQPLNIPPLKPSIIDHIRPARNVFPADSYICRTKFDENLIIMADEQQETQQGQYSKYTNNNAINNVQNQKANNNLVGNINNNINNNNNKNNNKTNQNTIMKNGPNYNQNRMNQFNPQGAVNQQTFSTQRTFKPSDVNSNTAINMMGDKQYNAPQSLSQNGQIKIANVNMVTSVQANRNIPGSGPILSNNATIKMGTGIGNMNPSSSNQMNSANNAVSNNNNGGTLGGNSRNMGNPEAVYVTEQFRMGSKYEGYKLNGVRHGYGKFYYQDGGMYDGDWNLNKMQGYGKLYYQSGKLAYEGNWKNDQFMGTGILYNELPEVLEQSFNYNNFDDVEDFWTKYQGEFSDDMKNGKGVLYLSNGQKFEGFFVSDSVEGPGIFYCKNGSKVVGNWEGNRKI